MASAHLLSDLEAIEILWRNIEPDVFISREQFIEGLADWKLVWITPYHVALVRGPEFHYSPIEDNKALSMRAIRGFLDSIIAKEGYALTRTAKDDARQQRFNKLLGFKLIGEDEFFIHFRIEKVR